MKPLEPKIIYQEAGVIVIDKPAGWVVNRADSVEEGSTIQDWADHRFKIQDSRYKNDPVFSKRSGIAHRIDKETSGILVIALDPETLSHLMNQFKSRTIQKNYWALVHGKVEPNEGGWRLPIGRSRFNRTEFRIDPFGKVSETEYKVIKIYPGDYTFLELYPKTGRTHQLRVHCRHMKHPIVADDKYASVKQLANDSRWCQRLFLHAHQIEFDHPTLKQRIKVEAALPLDLKEALAVVEKGRVK